MMFAIPGFGDKVKVRLFEEVQTVDTQYNIVDCGLQYKGENDEVQIDSIVMGGSFHTIKNLCGQLDEKAAKKAKKSAKKAAKKALKRQVITVITPTDSEAQVTEPEALTVS